jgi:hypothetical protein
MNVDIAAVMKDFTLDGTNQILTGPWRRIRRRQIGGVSARCSDCSARQYIPFPLGEVWRLYRPGDGDWAAGL